MSNKNTQVAANSGDLAAATEQGLASNKPQQTASEKFTNMVLREGTAILGENAVIPTAQKRLIQNNFIAADMALKAAETNRLKKPESTRDDLPVNWNNVNINKLAIDVMVFSSLGLDPTQNNHITPIIYKNNTTKKYDINFMVGYKGIELKAKKYGLEVPDSVTVELVYSTDVFAPIKKDHNNKVESYSFEIKEPFNRGEVIGGFWYHEFSKTPEKNKLRMFSKADIEKRKPKYASAEFWGGEKDKYENGKKAGKEEIDGWYEEMAYKTIYRDAYNKITIDSAKIDENYQRMVSLEQDGVKARVDEEISQNANSQSFVFDEAVEVVEDAPKTIPSSFSSPQAQPQPEAKLMVAEKEPIQMSIVDAMGNSEEFEPPFAQ
jgi:recombination protein RecT